MLLFAGAITTIMGQTLSNSTFDEKWEDCKPWDGNKQSSKAQGTQPNGWCIANVCGMNVPVFGYMGSTTVGTEGVGRTGVGKSVVLTNTPNPLSQDQIVPGYMSLGTTWATAQANMSGSVTDGTADGGSFGGIEFIYHPDAVHLYFKRAHNVGNKTNVINLNEKASVIAYTWKGKWTQNDVPQTTSLSNPAKYPMEDRDRNVMFNASGTVGGEITKTPDAELIASLEYYIEGDYSEWQELTIPFTYNSTNTPEKLNIIIGAEDYFADRSGIGNGNQITVDDVNLLYYSEIESAKYNGESISFDNEGNVSIDDCYVADKFTFAKKGVAATVEGPLYDPNTAQLTVTVKGEDISVNPSNFHTYTIQFAKKGDVNGDKQVTIADVTALVNIILGKDSQKAIADVNGDGSVTIADVTALVNIILGK